MKKIFNLAYDPTKPIHTLNKYWWLSIASGFIFYSGSILPVHSATNPTEIVTLQTAQNSTEQAIQAYHQGKFQTAQTLLTQAIQPLRSQNNPQELAYTLNILSLTQQQLGQWDVAEATLNEALALQTGRQNTLTYAQTLNNRGRLELQKGQEQNAVETWAEAEKIYQQLDDFDGVIAVRIHQSQALQALGKYPRARDILLGLLDQIHTQTDPQLKVSQLASLGMALQEIGRIETPKDNTKSSSKADVDKSAPPEIRSATDAFEAGLKVAIANDINPAILYLSLGNVAWQKNNTSKAIAHYEQAFTHAQTDEIRTKALLNQFQIYAENKNFDQAKALRNQLQPLLATLPHNRNNIYAQINFATTAAEIGEASATESLQYLAKAQQAAQQIGDRRAESETMGALGKLYYRQNNLEQARLASKSALKLATELQAKDVAFRWQWQLGQIYRDTGDRAQAVEYYGSALDSLETLRTDLVAVSDDAQFSFKESVEPIYREFIEVLLTSTDEQSPPSQADLRQARTVLESLQLAELDNFFRDACIPFDQQNIDDIINQNELGAAVVYPIILPERFAVITSLPDGSLHYHSTPDKADIIESFIDKIQESLDPSYSNNKRKQFSFALNQRLIKPFEAEFQKQDVSTLVFVLDGSLRNIPMASLYDGEQYLVEKYAIALTPGLQLLQSPELTKQQLQKVIIGGISKSTQGFTALPAVSKEVEQISSMTESKLLIDETFTREAFGEYIDTVNYPVVHLATHGQFSSNPEDTYLLMWDQKLSITELRELIEQREAPGKTPIDTMILSACQTATGDKRAALGLAGLAIRSGVRTTVATLWSVNDQSTSEFMSIFYEALNDPELDKSQALRKAQLALLKDPDSKFNHPYYWAPFIMIGSWF